MNAYALIGLIFVVSLGLLIAPFVAAGTNRMRSPLQIVFASAQFLPVVLAVIYFEYAETHLRIPIFSYERPPFSFVVEAVVALQIGVTSALMWKYQSSPLRKLLWVGLAAVGSAAFSFVAFGVVNCMNGNCF